MTVDQLLAKVEERLKEEYNSGTPRPTAIEATCWFVAVREATAIFDAWTVKDLAQEILKGVALGGPYYTTDDIQTWIGEMEDGYEGEDDTWDWIDEALDRHFGVRKEEK